MSAASVVQPEKAAWTGFAPEHLGCVQVRAEQVNEDLRHLLSVEHVEEMCFCAYSLMRGERVLACMGLRPMRQFSYAWALISDEAVRSCRIELVAGARALLDLHLDLHPVVAQAGFPQAEQWLEKLGFSRDGEEFGLPRFIRWAP